MGDISEALAFALKRADSNNQPPNATANTQLNARGFVRFTDSQGYEYVNRNTIASPTGDGKTHVILFQYEPIKYLKLDANMETEEAWYWDTLPQILAFLDGPDYTGNGIKLQVSFDAVLV